MHTWKVMIPLCLFIGVALAQPRPKTDDSKLMSFIDSKSRSSFSWSVSSLFNSKKSSSNEPITTTAVAAATTGVATTGAATTGSATTGDEPASSGPASTESPTFVGYKMKVPKDQDIGSEDSEITLIVAAGFSTLLVAAVVALLIIKLKASHSSEALLKKEEEAKSYSAI